MYGMRTNEYLRCVQSELRKEAFDDAEGYLTLVEGGQGRSGEELTEETIGLVRLTLVILIICIVLPFLVGCAYSERDAANQLNVSKKAEVVK